MVAVVDETPLPGSDAAQRQLLGRAATIGLLMRHSANLGVAAVTLANPDSDARPLGKVLMWVIAGWAVYRISTRSPHWRYTAVDYGFIVAVCAAIPLLETDPHFYASNSAPQAIAGTAVISFAVAIPVGRSLAMTALVAVAYAWGAAALVGAEHLGSITAIYYFFLQWGTAGAIRLTSLRVAGAVDGARRDREAAEVAERVTDARRNYDREQLALLHDTVASTLLLVGQNTAIAIQRLANQAKRDLDVLRSRPWAVPDRTELVGALRTACAHAQTPVEFAGTNVLSVDGETAAAVLSATREAVTNVDRHANATRVVIDVRTDGIVVDDDGDGFDGRPRSGRYGISESIVARMARVGGTAVISSAPGRGTRVELRWTAADSIEEAAVTDPDRFIERVRVGYGFALCAYALVNLVVTVPYVVAAARHPTDQVALGGLTALATVTSVASIRYGHRWPTRPALLVLAAVTVIQPLLLDTTELVSQAHWAQGAIGWCVLPLLLGMPARRAALILAGYWLLGSLLIVLRNDSGAALVNVGLGTASILAVQLYALLFSDLLRNAARDARAETDAHLRLITGEGVAEAVRADYSRRYGDLMERVMPLLTTMSLGTPLSLDLRQRARIETQRLRRLFDQSASSDHQLVRDVRAIVDEAEHRGIDVTVHVDGHLPNLNAHGTDRLLDPVQRLLDQPVASARLVLTATDGVITASLVCVKRPSTAIADPELLRVHDGVVVITAEDTTWLTVRQVAIGG
jgi:hypothetical protein